MTYGITRGQEKQIRRFMEDALIKAGFDKEMAQELIANGGEFQDGLVELMKRLSVTNEFADEETESGYGYLSGYKPRPFAEQVTILHQQFPQLGSCNESLASGQVPAGAEGWFAIPRWQKLASTYGEAVELVLSKLNEQRSGKFMNYREGKLGSQQLRETTQKAKAFEVIGREQEGNDLLIVGAQFGLEHCGKSVRRVRAITKRGRQFGLGAFEIAIMLLTHPERLQHVNDLWIDCSGDEYSFGAGGQFGGAPYFVFRDALLGFSADDVASASADYGSASGFLPQL